MAVPSAKTFAQKLSDLAHRAAGREPPPAAKKTAVPLVPIYVGIDRADKAEHEQLRETFLYRLGDPKWSVKPATSRFLLEAGLPGGNTERVVEEMLKAGLKPYADWKDTGRSQLVKLEFYVQLGKQVFRDEVVWDLANPNNGSEPYAVRVCADLRLGCDWFDAIRAHVQQRLDEVKQDLREAPQEVDLQPPVKKIRRTPAAAAAGAAGGGGGGGDSSAAEAGAEQAGGEDAEGTTGQAGGGSSSSREGVPRLEPYDAAHDTEAAQLAARQQKLQARKQRQQQQQQQAAAQAQQQQQQQVQQQQQPMKTEQQAPPPSQQAQQQQQTPQLVVSPQPLAPQQQLHSPQQVMGAQLQGPPSGGQLPSPLQQQQQLASPLQQQQQQLPQQHPNFLQQQQQQQQQQQLRLQQAAAQQAQLQQQQQGGGLPPAQAGLQPQQLQQGHHHPQLPGQMDGGQMQPGQMHAAQLQAQQQQMQQMQQQHMGGFPSHPTQR